ncbi:MAG: hypothetical protein JW974_03035 [Alphaproteobacteria bacterium]|nr:hypothetical protein [Alphaproteobacteria bacterium]MBN2674928.1 hypothetical protein [Alphaproteobacteria bacterium]
MDNIFLYFLIAALCFIVYGIIVKFENNKKKEFESLLTDSGFIVSEKLAYSSFGGIFCLDSENKLWAVSEVNKIYRFQDIVKVEVVQDGKTISSGGLGRAFALGVLAGGVGAVVGATTGRKISENKLTDLRIKITINDFKNPIVYINCLTPNKNISMEMVQKFQSVLDLILVNGKSKHTIKQDEIINKFNQNIG